MPSPVSLDFEKGKGGVAIAKVKDGEYKGETLYLHQDGQKGGKGGVQELELGKHRLGKLPARKQHDVMRILQEAFARGIPPEHLSPELTSIPGVMDAYVEMSGAAREGAGTHIKLPHDSHFQLMPTTDPKKREVWYIAGASGSGKSHIAKGIAEQYMKQFPDRDVYLVSKLEADDTLDSMKGRQCIRLKPDKLVEKPIKTTEDLKMLSDSLVIFDDYDTFVGPAEKVIHKLIDDLATMGRHTNTTMLCLSHYLTNYKKTRLLLNEATHIIVYPMATSFHALSYLLKTHIGMTRDDCRDLKKMGRWVCMYKHYPQWLISTQHARILNQ